MTAPDASPVRVSTTLQVTAALALGIPAMASAAILIRLAQGAGVPSMVIAAGRLVLSALLLTPLAYRASLAPIRSLRPRTFWLVVASGLILALHFTLWIGALEYVSVIIGVMLINSSPVWVALFEAVLLRAWPKPLVLAGIVLVLASSALMALTAAPGTGLGSNPLLGGALAAVGAVAAAAYLIIGRWVKDDLPLMSYLWLAYGCSAVAGAVVLLIFRLPVTGYLPVGYLWVALLAIIPHLIGHSAMNFALRHFSATYVSVATQLVPIIAALAAIFVFHEVPRLPQIVGAVGVVCGITLATLGQIERRAA